MKKKLFFFGMLAISFALLGSGFLITQFWGNTCPNAGVSNETDVLGTSARNPQTASDPSPIPKRSEGSFQSADVGIYELVEDIFFLTYHWGFYLGIALDPKNVTHDEIILYGFVFMEQFGFVSKMTTSLDFNSTISYAGENHTDQALLSDTAPDKYITNYVNHIPLHDYPMCHYIVPRNLQAETLRVRIEFRLSSSQFDRSGIFGEDREVPVCRQGGCAVAFPSTVILILAAIGCAIAGSVYIMHWRTKGAHFRGDLPTNKDQAASATTIPYDAGRWTPQSLWKWRVFCFTGILASIFLVPDLYFFQINSPYYNNSYMSMNWEFITWYASAGGVAMFYPFWWTLVRFTAGFLVPVNVGLWNSFKTRQAIRTEHPSIPTKVKQRTIWGLSFALFWISSMLVSALLDFLYYSVGLGFEHFAIPLPSIIALSFGIILAYLTFNLPRTRPLDFQAWTPPSVLTGPLYLREERSAQKLWIWRLIYTIIVWGILFGWEFVRIYFPYRTISPNIIVHYEISSSRIITIVFEYFTPLVLGITSSLLTWWNFTRRGRNVSRLAKLMGKSSVIIFGFAVISTLINAINYRIPSYEWESILLWLVFDGGNIPALFLLWRLQQITFEYPTSKARDFRWPPAVPGQNKGARQLAGEQPLIQELESPKPPGSQN